MTLAPESHFLSCCELESSHTESRVQVVVVGSRSEGNISAALSADLTGEETTFLICDSHPTLILSAGIQPWTLLVTTLHQSTVTHFSVCSTRNVAWFFGTHLSDSILLDFHPSCLAPFLHLLALWPPWGLLFVRHASNGDQNLKWFGVPAQGTSSVVYVHLYVRTKSAVSAPDVKRSNDGVGCEEMDQKKNPRNNK